MQIFTEQIDEVTILLRKYAGLEAAISAYYKYLITRQVITISGEVKLEKTGNKSHTSLQAILNRARTKQGNYPGFYSNFGHRATVEELETVLDHLISETDLEICLRLLWIFFIAPIPQLISILFEWANCDHQRLRESALKVLSRKSDDLIYELARSRMESWKVLKADTSTIDLFINNYHLGDAKIIEESLKTTSIDIDDFHSIGCSINVMADNRCNTLRTLKF